VGAPVQVTEQVKEGDTVHLNPSEMEQVKGWELSSGDRTGFGRGYSPFKPERNGAGQRVGAPVQVTEQVLGEDKVHLNPSEMEQVKGWKLQYR
jgi:hypothetical protein